MNDDQYEFRFGRGENVEDWVLELKSASSRGISLFYHSSEPILSSGSLVPESQQDNSLPKNKLQRPPPLNLNSPFGVVSEVVHEESLPSHTIPIPKPRNDIQSSIDSNQISQSILSSLSSPYVNHNQSLQNVDRINHSHSAVNQSIQQDNNSHSQSTLLKPIQQDNNNYPQSIQHDNNNHPKPFQQPNQQQQHTSQVHLPPPPPPPLTANNMSEQVSSDTIKQQQSTPIIQNTLLHPLPSYIGADSNPRNLSQDQGIDDTIHVLFNFSAF